MVYFKFLFLKNALINMESIITLKKVSMFSSYSLTTVSKALKNKHEVSEKAKRKIQKLVKEVSYVANNSAIS